MKENPEESGEYRVWDMVSGYSFIAYWDNDLQKWIIPKEMEDPNYEPEIWTWDKL